MRYRELHAFSVEPRNPISWRDAIRDAVRHNGERWPEDVIGVSNAGDLDMVFTISDPSFYEPIDLVVWTERYVYAAASDEGMGYVAILARHPDDRERELAERIIQ
jgi:hypothetical protein